MCIFFKNFAIFLGDFANRFFEIFDTERHFTPGTVTILCCSDLKKLSLVSIQNLKLPRAKNFLSKYFKVFQIKKQAYFPTFETNFESPHPPPPFFTKTKYEQMLFCTYPLHGFPRKADHFFSSKPS